MSAEEIHSLVNRGGAAIHLATVYRALQALTSSGEVKRSSLSENHAHYELGANAGVHLLCEGCGQLREEKLGPAERMVNILNRRLGGRFRVRTWQMQVTGLCRHCRGREA